MLTYANLFPFVGTISIGGLKMSVNENDTVLLLRTRSPTDSEQKPILQQNYIQIDRNTQG